MSKVSTKCFKCGGVGIWVNQTDGGDVPVDPCPICNGAGFVPVYDVDFSEVMSKLDEILAKCDEILGALPFPH